MVEEFFSAEIISMDGDGMAQVVTSDVHDFAVCRGIEITAIVGGKFAGYPILSGYIGPMSASCDTGCGARYESIDAHNLLSA